jgi:uncharacterized RDD family membrane protein YckC
VPGEAYAAPGPGYAPSPGYGPPPGGGYGPQPGYAQSPGYAPPPGYAPSPGYGPPPGGGYGAPANYAPPGGYSVPPNAVPGYGYPPAGARPGPVGPGGAPLAEFWQRFVAYLVDSLIVSAAMIIPMIGIFALVLIPAIASAGTTTGPDPFGLLLLELLAFAIIVPLQVLATYVYFVVMARKTGQTVGKRIMKIRIVRAADGGPITPKMARRRWLVLHVSALIAFYFSFADGLWQLWDQPYRQCLHDKCAETVVVQVMA